jgi:hypothetical protein
MTRFFFPSVKTAFIVIDNGWPALGDGYCNVERRRDWMGFKLVNQQAGAKGLKSSYRPPTAGLVRTRRRPPGPPRRSSEGCPGLNGAMDSSLTPTYLALVSSERLCPRDRGHGAPTRARPTPGRRKPGRRSRGPGTALAPSGQTTRHRYPHRIGTTVFPWVIHGGSILRFNRVFLA